MQESIEGRYVQKGKCSVPEWGADEKFFTRITQHNSNTFVSTGKEQRDFDILIEAFQKRAHHSKSLLVGVMQVTTLKISPSDAKIFLI